jgi:hypothetical protein
MEVVIPKPPPPPETVGEAIFLLIAGALTVGVALSALHRMSKARRSPDTTQTSPRNGSSDVPTTSAAPY